MGFWNTAERRRRRRMIARALRREARKALSTTTRREALTRATATSTTTTHYSTNADAYAKLKPGITWPKACNDDLKTVDPEIFDIIEREKERQIFERSERCDDL